MRLLVCLLTDQTLWSWSLLAISIGGNAHGGLKCPKKHLLHSKQVRPTTRGTQTREALRLPGGGLWNASFSPMS